MSKGGGSWLPSVKSGTETMGEGSDRMDGQLMRQAARPKEGRKAESGVMRPHGQRKDPQGVPVGRGDGDWIYLPLPARAERMRSKVNSRQSPR